MKIVGHRGNGRGALENTREGIRAGLKAGASEIEVDIRLTRDKRLVLSHDKTLRRVSGQAVEVASASLKDLQRIKLRNGEAIVTLEEALALVPPGTLVIEGKGYGWPLALAELLNRDAAKVRGVISFKHAELAAFHHACSNVRAYPLALFNPFKTLRAARQHGFAGVGIGFWLMNPLVYRLLKKAELEIYVYTVNSVWLARVLKTFYPDIHVATDYPAKLARLAN